MSCLQSIKNINSVGYNGCIGVILTVNGTLDINDSFDATGATVNLGSSAKLILNGSVTSLGTLDALEGTVEYDGGTQNVIADAYENLRLINPELKPHKVQSQ